MSNTKTNANIVSTKSKKKRDLIMTDRFEDELRAHVASSNSLKDLLPLLPYISLDVLKQAICQNMNGMQPESIKKMHCNSLSIHKIIPSDLIQHVLSFQGLDLKHVKCVNKQWNKLSNKNEKKYHLALQEKLDQNSPIPYDKSINNTWIVHSERNKLTRVEKELGFKLVLRSRKDDMLNSSEVNGDRFYVFSGNYICGTKSIFNNDASIIGINVGDKPLTKYILSEAAMEIKEGCKLWIEGFRAASLSAGIIVNRNASLLMTDCEWYSIQTAIEVNMNAEEVTIKDSVFTECKDCIEMVYDGEHASVRLVCDGNLFRNIKRYTIYERAGLQSKKMYIDKTELYQLKNNSLDGDNDKKISDANKIYFNDIDDD